MTLIIEDGTGTVSAESYISVADADDWHLRLNNPDWPQPPPDGPDPDKSRKEAALRKAALFLDARSAAKVNGERKNPAQGLLFPRTGATDAKGQPLQGIPTAYKNAQAEAARLALTGTDLAPDTPAGPLARRKRIDVLETEWVTGTHNRPATHGWLNTLLAPLFGPAWSGPRGSVQTLDAGRG